MASRNLSVAAAGLGLVAAGALAWGTLVERRMYTLRHHAIRLGTPRPQALRILHLSDLHMAPWQSDKAGWVAALAETEPDLVLVTGDFFGHPRALDRIREALTPFTGVPGAFVFGSNDYFVSRPKNPFGYFAGPSQMKRRPERLDTLGLRRFLTDGLGWVDVDNTAAVLEVGARRIAIVGVNDPHLRYDRMDDALSELDSVTQGGGGADLTIGVTHAPYQRVLDAFTQAGCDLIVAGHTHGGQVCLPGFGALVTNCDIPRAQASGLSAWESDDRVSMLNVSAGIGTSIYAPVRFACRPEASLLDIVPEIEDMGSPVY